MFVPPIAGMAESWVPQEEEGGRVSPWLRAACQKPAGIAARLESEPGAREGPGELGRQAGFGSVLGAFRDAQGARGKPEGSNTAGVFNEI